jgi:cell division septation protein DedD
VAEGETQYNIPVSSKQLIVYFVFLVIALSAAFLAGVMVGRNVDSSPEPVVRDIDDRGGEDVSPTPTPTTLTYGSTLQSDKVEGLATPAPAAAAATPRASVPEPTPQSTPAPRTAAPATRETPPQSGPRGTPRATPALVRATPTPRPSVRATPTPRNARAAATPLNRLTIQVGAFKERSAAEAIVRRLKGKGYSAYLAPVSEGLFNVRVGSFENREDAERILAKLETQEKFKPFIVKP